MQGARLFPTDRFKAAIYDAAMRLAEAATRGEVDKLHLLVGRTDGTDGMFVIGQLSAQDHYDRLMALAKLFADEANAGRYNGAERDEPEAAPAADPKAVRRGN